VSAGCVFCGIVAGAKPAEIVASNDRALAFLDHAPASDGHTLVIPRVHAHDIWDLEAADGDAVWRLAREVADRIRFAIAPDGLTLVQANGEAGGQDVFHFHLHVIPRWWGDRFVRHWRPHPAPGDPAQVADRLRSSSV
jgi:histidine triad (HIT) family protein